jgi:cysteine desulfurase
MSKKIIYLDHAATTPLSLKAGEAMVERMYSAYGNPSSLHQVGRQAHDILAESKKQMAKVLGVLPQEIILTGSGTESDNLALFGLARAYKNEGNHIIISAIEHKAVLVAAKELEREGFSVTYLPVDTYGRVSVSDVVSALTPKTILVSIMYANNEIGTIEPIEEIGKEIQNFRNASGTCPIFHTDACQAVGLLPISPQTLGVDAMTINSSKIYGPKGIGLLYVRQGVKVSPVIVGGDQERGLRAGTENVALVAGFAAALYEAEEMRESHAVAMTTLQSYFIQLLKEAIPGIQLNGHPEYRLQNNVHVTIPDVEGESLVLMLGEEGICCATGSACSSLDLVPSHVLVAIGQDVDVIHGSLRFTFGRDTTQEELRYTTTVLAEVVERLRNITASTTSAYKKLKENI